MADVLRSGRRAGKGEGDLMGCGFIRKEGIRKDTSDHLTLYLYWVGQLVKRRHIAPHRQSNRITPQCSIPNPATSPTHQPCPNSSCVRRITQYPIRTHDPQRRPHPFYSPSSEIDELSTASSCPLLKGFRTFSLGPQMG